MTIDVRVNGETRTVDVDGETPLLYVLRNDLGLKGSRFGCGEGTCGACMVLVDGEAAPSCDMPVSVAEGKDIVTIESVDHGTLERLRRAFEAEQAGQCAYCATGILIAAAGLLERNPGPSREEIGEALDDNLCRCGAHDRMITAVQRAAAETEPVPVRISARPEPLDDAPEGGLGNDHLTVMPDGTVLMTSGKVDLGQGVTTALAQIAADTLGVSIRRIRVVRTDTARSPDEGTTAGSYTIERGGSALRAAAEELRLRLLALASEDLGEAETLEVRDGTVTSASGRSTTYWALVNGEDTLGSGEADGAVEGTAVPRWDLPPKFRGLPSFIQDLDLPGMLHGRVARPPGRGHRLSTFESDRTASMPGVVEVVGEGEYLGVVAEREDQVLRAVRALQNDAAWTAPESSGVDYNDPSYLRDRESEDQIGAEPEGTMPQGSTTLRATYTRPFIAHASIGPSCGIARWDDEDLTVWSHSQNVFALRRAIARAYDMPEERIRVMHREGAGCYGHNGADDAAFDAVVLARTVPGRPVRVQYSREDEFAWEPYGPAMVIDMEATLDEEGSILGWSHEAWSHPHSARPGLVDGNALVTPTLWQHDLPGPSLSPMAMPRGGMLRNSLPLYDLPYLSVTGHFVRDAPARTSALRALGAHPNVFAIESFMDELAEAAGVDPVEFRLRHLSDPRAREVIEAVVERAAVPVGGQSEEGHGYGLGFARYKNTACYVAVVAEVEAEQEVRLLRAWAALDAGHVVNPDGAANQIEGGMIQSASWALKERVAFDGDLVASRSWLDYPILTFSEIPELDVVVLDRPEEPSLGVGEGAQGPTTAAIANAVHAALGVRVRDLPITPDRVMKAILG